MEQTRSTAKAPLARCSLDSPIGRLTVVASDAGVRAVLWPDDTRRMSAAEETAPEVEVTGAQRALLDAARRQLDEYFAGHRTRFDLPLDPVGTPFQQHAWAVLRTIGFGTTISYRAQAEALGDPRRARAVGAANGRNPISIVVPCHRVVASNGALTGFAGGVDVKAWLLDHERRVAAGT